MLKGAYHADDSVHTGREQLEEGDFQAIENWATNGFDSKSFAFAKKTKVLESLGQSLLGVSVADDFDADPSFSSEASVDSKQVRAQTHAPTNTRQRLSIVLKPRFLPPKNCVSQTFGLFLVGRSDGPGVLRQSGRFADRNQGQGSGSRNVSIWGGCRVI